MEINTLIITQARMGSSRLPGKILKKIGDKTLLEIHVDRLLKSVNADAVMIATTINPYDEVVYDLARKMGVMTFRGAENDVLDRFYQAAKQHKPNWVVRVTSDCPLLDPQLIDLVILKAKETSVDYCSNILIEHFPDGQDVEVFTFNALEKAWHEAKLPSEREHVTPYIRNNINGKGKSIFSAVNYNCEKDYSATRMTVDEPADFRMIEALISELGSNCSWQEYVNYMTEHDFDKYNGYIKRNEGYFKSLKSDI